MKCPYCGHTLPPRSTICPNCGATVTRPIAPEEYHAPWFEKHRWLVTVLAVLLAFLLSVAAIVLPYNFIRNYSLRRDYTRGALTPQVSEILLSDDRPGHSVLFFGNDGDSIFIPELRTSYRIADGIARVAIPDSIWFEDETIEDEANDTRTITLRPQLHKKGGETVELPQLNINVAAPHSPLTVLEPAQESTTVFTTMMPLTFRVVPGSTVLINGMDATSQVDRNGDISYNVNVYPIGDNNFSILVKTPDHRETRRDVVYRREQMAIEISLDATTPTQHSASTLKVTGVTEPDSSIVVDSPHVDGSVIVDHESGAFSFIANLETIGTNKISFHAERGEDAASKERAFITFNVKYVPSLNEYSRKAWKMDYPSLVSLYEQWTGRVFLCKGYVTDVFYEEDVQFVVMNVAESGADPQLVILQNESGVALPDKTTLYEAYADVTGRKYHDSSYYPLLCARYMDEAE